MRRYSKSVSLFSLFSICNKKTQMDAKKKVVEEHSEKKETQ